MATKSDASTKRTRHFSRKVQGGTLKSDGTKSETENAESSKYIKTGKRKFTEEDAAHFDRHRSATKILRKTTRSDHGHDHLLATPDTLEKEKNPLPTTSDVPQVEASEIAVKHAHVYSKTYSVKADERDNCQPFGIVAADDGRKIITDINGWKISVFDINMEPLGHSERLKVWDIALLNDNEAIVTSLGDYIYFVDIDMNIPYVKRKLNTSDNFIASRVTTCKGNMYVTNTAQSDQVIMIDKDANIIWRSIPYEPARELFSPISITSYFLNDRVRVVVADNMMYSLTLLDGKTGNVLSSRQLIHNGIISVSTDLINSIFTCSEVDGVVTRMKLDLSKERVILSKPTYCMVRNRDAADFTLFERPNSLAYDKRSHSLIVTTSSPEIRDQIKIFELVNC